MSTTEVKIVISGNASSAVAAGKAAEGAIKGVGQAGQVSAAQTANAMRMLPAQLTDVVTQLQGGASPLTVLIQQGGQVKDMFGGIGPTIKAFAGLLTPAAVAVGAVAASVGTLALALYQGRSESAEFAKSLVLTGNYAGVSASQLTDMAAQVSAASRVTTGAARELAANAVATGAFGQQSVAAVTAAMATLQRISGASTQDVVNDFASMSKGVAAWAAEHNRQYAFLTKAEYDQIKALEQHGQVERAMAITSDALNKTLKSREQDLGYMEKAWRSVAGAASDAWDAMKGWGRADDTAAKIEKAKADLKAFDAWAASRNRDQQPAIDTKRAQMQAGIEALQAQAMAEQEMESANAEAAARNRQKINDDAAGKADALANAQADLRLARIKNASALQVAALDMAQQQEEALYKLGLTSTQAYEDQRVAAIRKSVAAQAAEVDKEIAVIKSRPTNGPASETEQAAKVAEAEGRRVAIITAGSRQIAQVYADSEQRMVDDARQKAQQWADAWTQAQAEVKTQRRSNADLQIGLIRDPNARERAQVAEQIRRMQEDAAAKVLPWQVIVDTTANPEQKAALQAQIDDVLESLRQGVALKNDALEEALKPGWQKTLEGWRDNNRLMRDSFNTMMDGIVKNAEDAWVEFVTTGKINVKNLVNAALAEMARLQFRQLISGSGSGGFGGLGSLWSAAKSGFNWLSGLGGGSAAISNEASMEAAATWFFHSGGLVGAEGRAGTAAADSWARAPRFHTGGLAGNEVPAILQTGEGVFTKGQMRALGAGLQSASTASGVTVSMPTTIMVDSRTDQGQIAQLVRQAMAQTERRMWNGLRVKGVVG